MKFKFPSDYDAAKEVQKSILAEVERLKYHEESAFAIKLATEEGLVNAVKHGNKHDPAKFVLVEVDVDPERIEIIIEDEGPGFDRTCVPDPTAIENLTKCSGRGILLIESYMDSVEWSKDGRRVRMTKRNRKAD